MNLMDMYRMGNAAVRDLHTQQELLVTVYGATFLQMAAARIGGLFSPSPFRFIVVQSNNQSNMIAFHPFPIFPPLSIHTVFDFGQTRTTEQKMLSSEGIFLRRKQRREYYEQQ